MKKEQIIKRLKKMVDDHNFFSNTILNSNDNQISMDIVSEIISYMFCCNSNHLDFDQVKKQILENKNIDVLQIGDGHSAITNQQVHDLIEKMSMSSIGEQNIKFFIIKNAENLKNTSANSILKFLEEPPVNTYGFLLTNNYSEIITTILSRCQLVNIDNEQKIDEQLNVFEELLIKKNKEEILLFGSKLKSMSRNDQIKLISDAYHKTIVHKFFNCIEPTLEVLDDLKFLPITNISIDNYLIRIVEEI
ncbi:DNA polymerase III subunit delta [Mycoplasma cottewii]|uniref:DNA polymerase III subunit delta n=1 Tax=Mycoplasma cottewii TaxID=51364 RepID=A0ABY5TXU4_9MOLU|nr:DNA polymerase III subunit delta [Mycoplasma cottewii]UWD35020.1 DNA polymerase III subunit delta [Mycoplasma cottewii]